jgi:hypothetical protein
VFRSDNGDASVEQSEMAIRSMCPDVDMTGVQTIQMKHVAVGDRIRTYVLVGLPIGNANVLKGVKDAQKRAPEAFKELDEVTGNAPVSQVPSSKTDSVAVVNSDGTSGQLNLLPVDNAEYRAKRDAALQKPGAVVGHATVTAE